MSQSKRLIKCGFCASLHEPRFLCDPAKRVLDALIERGMSFNMPTLEFPQPLSGQELGLGAPGDKLVAQLVVMAGVVDAAGIPQPMLAITGRAHDGAVLPRWIYPATDEDILRTRDLVVDMADLAIRTAAAQRQPQTPESGV